MKAVVFAAGRGERLWPLTENKPKHLLPIAGKPVLERTLEALSKAGVREVRLIVNFQAEKIRARLGDGKRLGCKIRYVKQKRIGGTADALNASRKELRSEDRFLAIYGDDYYHEKVVASFLKKAAKGNGLMMGAVLVQDPSRFGSLTVKNGLVHRIKEKVTRKGPGRVNAGIYLLDSSIFPAIEKTPKSSRGEFELTDSLQMLIQQGRRVQAFSFKEGEWLGLSYPWDLLEANRLALENRRPAVAGKMEDGVHTRGPVIIAKGAVVKSGSYLEGPVLVGEGSVVGPSSYLRPYTSLGQNVKVGAGCEVKNSIVMDNAKIPHLSYVGDSIIGEDSSLGAGTITANLRFDEAHVKSRIKGLVLDSGRKKLGAILGDNVRTGINVSIFPGVKIGAGAWVGPGAIVREDVPSGARIQS